MTRKSEAMLRVVTGNGIIPRPVWLERILTAFDTRKTTIDLSRLSDAQLKDIAEPVKIDSKGLIKKLIG